MDDKTIARIEEKYLITPREEEKLLAKIVKHLAHDKYFCETVTSLYFDTKDFELAIRSIDRPDFRYKIRLRSYETPKLSTPIFFEIKTKLKQGNKKIGNKRRIVLPLKDFYHYYDEGADLEAIIENIPNTDKNQSQIARELEYIMRFKQLEPKMIIYADRTAYIGSKLSDFRLTFDRDLRFRTTNLRLEKGTKSKKYFPLLENSVERNRCIIMEVKTFNAMPSWFVNALSELKIYPSRFSKYGKIYQLIKERNLHV